jgi:hypothetical protein
MNEQPDKFRFTFFIRDLITKVLDNAPDDWLKTKITYKTDSFYKAVRRSLTLPLKFVFEGARLLRNEIYTYGLAGVLVQLQVEKQVSNTWDYANIYNGKLDFTKGKDGQTNYAVDSISSDFTVQLDAYDNTAFALELNETDPDVIKLTLPTLALSETCDFIMASSPDFRSDAFFSMKIVNYQQFAQFASVQEPGFVAQVAPDFTTVGQWFFKAQIATNIRIFGSMALSVNSGHYQLNVYRSSDGSLVKTIWDATLSITTEQTFSFDFMTSVAQGERLLLYFLNLTDDNTFTGINMQSGTVSIQYKTGTEATTCLAIRAYDVFQRLLKWMNIVSIYEPQQPVPNQSYLLDPSLDSPATPVPFKDLVYTCSNAIRAFYPDPVTGVSRPTVIEQIYQAGDTLQPGGKYTVLGIDDNNSEVDVYIMYNSIRYNFGDSFNWVLGFDTFTAPTGFAFVQQTAATPTILMPFRDFFQDILALQGGQAALSVTAGKVYLEDLSFFYRAGSGSLNIGTVDTKTTIEPAADMIFNTIKGGYKDQQYDPTNAQTEVNSEVVYILNLIAESKLINLQAVSRADPFGIEITRVTPVDTSSSRSDNDNFMIMIKDTPEEDGTFKPKQMDACTSFAGVDISYYNWEITPKQNLKRGFRYLRSIFDKMDGYTIRVSAPLKSTALITTDANGNTVNEAQAETISAAFGTQLFLPYYFNVNAGLPLNALSLIDGTPFADIGFTWDDIAAKGFPVEIAVDVGENSPQNFKLLASPSNNMLNFIR